MFQIYLFKIINTFSLVFIICGIFMSSIYSQELVFIMFLYTCVIILISSLLKVKKQKLNLLPLVLLFIPLMFTINLELAFFIVSLICFSVYFINSQINKPLFKYDSNNFKLWIIFILVTVIPTIISLPKYMWYLIPYMFFYLTSSIILSRIIRHLKYCKDLNDFNKINIKFFLFISLFLFLLNINYCRRTLFSLLNWILSIFSLISTIISFLVGKILLFFLYYSAKFINFLGSIFIKHRFQVGYGKSHSYEIIESNYDWLISIIVILFKIFIVIVIIYCIRKLLKHKYVSKFGIEEFESSHEFIVNKTLNNPLKKILKSLKAKIPKEYIRLYYSKYLIKCRKNNIDLKENYTTLDIDLKSQQVFQKQLTNNLRKLYIKARYSDLYVTKEEFEDFLKYYKEL